jgi:hypothetical protein
MVVVVAGVHPGGKAGQGGVVQLSACSHWACCTATGGGLRVVWRVFRRQTAPGDTPVRLERYRPALVLWCVVGRMSWLVDQPLQSPPHTSCSDQHRSVTFCLHRVANSRFWVRSDLEMCVADLNTMLLGCKKRASTGKRPHSSWCAALSWVVHQHHLA